MKHKLLNNPLKSSIEWSADKIKFQLILMRHAESKFNSEIRNIQQYKNQLDKEEFIKLKHKIRFSEELLDCEITKKGVQQCQEAGKNLKNYKIKYVFVSPMKRCLMTAQNALESAGQSPEVIVHPNIFEKIEDSCDILQDITQNMKQWKHFNWDLFKNIEHLPIYQFKFCDVISKTHTPYITQFKNEIYHNLALQNYIQHNNYKHHEIILEAMRCLGKDEIYIESSTKTLERLLMFKKDLNNILPQKALEEDEKILVVGHSILFKHLTTKYIKEESYEPEEHETVLKNCQIAGVKFD